jgi:DNA helicase-2/ATP-dependent DNA helicase PcrA
VGEDVVHPKYGEGVVLKVTGTGEDAEAVIRFRDHGEKRFLVGWAPLRRATTAEGSVD